MSRTLAVGVLLAVTGIPGAIAQVSITTFGATDAQACFQDAGDGVTTSSARCDLALRDTKLVERDRLATFVNRGIVLNRAGRLDEALAGFDSALAGDPGLAEAWLNRGNTLFLQGSPDAALEDYRQSLALGIRRDHVAWYNIGLVHAAGNQPGAAWLAWLESLVRNPEFTLVVERLGLSGPGAADLAQLMLWMVGGFDNRQQHAAQATPAGAEPQFSRLYLKRRVAVVPALGAQVLYSQINEGDESGPIYRQIFLVFERDAAGRISSRAWRWRERDSAPELATRLDQLVTARAGDFEPALPPGCDMHWQRDGQQFTGRTAAADCSVISGRDGQPRGIRATEIVGPGLLMSEEAGFAPDGSLLFGLPDGVYYRFDPLAGGR